VTVKGQCSPCGPAQDLADHKESDIDHTLRPAFAHAEHELANAAEFFDCKKAFFLST
jgi:hypothetical protein